MVWYRRIVVEVARFMVKRNSIGKTSLTLNYPMLIFDSNAEHRTPYSRPPQLYASLLPTKVGTLLPFKTSRMKQLFLAIILLGAFLSTYAQDILLQDCFRIAGSSNILVQQTKTSLLARQYNLAAEKQRYAPKIDALASYTYFSRPLEINLQTVREGILDGSSKQAVNAANTVFQEITGNQLSQTVQDKLYNTSKTILGAVYPDYNPPLSKQSYFLAGLVARQPIYLGNKLTAARNFAESEVTAGTINISLAEKDVQYAIAVQHIRVLYLNTLLQDPAGHSSRL